MSLKPGANFVDRPPLLFVGPHDISDPAIASGAVLQQVVRTLRWMRERKKVLGAGDLVSAHDEPAAD